MILFHPFSVAAAAESYFDQKSVKKEKLWLSQRCVDYFLSTIYFVEITLIICRAVIRVHFCGNESKKSMTDKKFGTIPEDQSENLDSSTNIGKHWDYPPARTWSNFFPIFNVDFKIDKFEVIWIIDLQTGLSLTKFHFHAVRSLRLHLQKVNIIFETLFMYEGWNPPGLVCGEHFSKKLRSLLNRFGEVSWVYLHIGVGNRYGGCAKICLLFLFLFHDSRYIFQVY